MNPTVGGREGVGKEQNKKRKESHFLEWENVAIRKNLLQRRDGDCDHRRDENEESSRGGVQGSTVSARQVWSKCKSKSEKDEEAAKKGTRQKKSEQGKHRSRQ
eukprot:5748465-Pleurochrysis_carterae.AAC.1